MAYRETEKMRQRKALARQRILDCAQLRVTEGGFRNAQISQVASQAEVATGTIYRHFESKEELFAEVFRAATEREVGRVAKDLAGDGDAVERLAQALRHFARRALRAPTMAWALIAEPVDPRVEAERLRYRRAYAELFEAAIREGVREGSLPAQEARHSSTCLVGAIAESLVGPLSPAQSTDGKTPPTDYESLVNTIVGFCLQGLTGTRR
ncbi:TetR/AcrR family transcriptional regulator [Marinobacter sp. SS21]|uniref:TetR/AcrR family transcriptional regulator n=1 Tax=Marinobacter sp. SS21 TaxID=2979460 RepID=UPI00232DCA05|nr:TetR/AcrR family transcriptional regulator [Marinobacter sp. SS21]MDC0662250.1 TetR/AcrR family transcriptional regulator [Marinobacter sp. SS21]